MPQSNAALANPDAPVDNVPLVTDDERELLLNRWNDTAADYPLGDPLHALFEQTARQFPDQIALVFEGQALSYSMLDSRANRLAHFLRGHGVGPDVPVGLCAERSLEMVVAMLGILKAGGAYVPLDPDYPAERLNSIVADARPPVVLTLQRLLGSLAGLAVPIFCLDRDWDELESLDASAPDPLATPSDLAYVIYTSGSTGTPKGAMNTHQGICNRLIWMQDAYRLTPEDRVLQKTPYSFDVSVWEFFWPLLVGARVVLARPGGHRDPDYLASLIRDAGITVLHFVPSMLQVFLEQPGLEAACLSVRHVFASGEALPESTARRCLARLRARLHNLYGPTEAAVDVTYRECRREDPPGPVPIGKPIANMRTYVLDDRRQLLPIGVPGELFLAGVGVARGYLGRPELTAERFLPDPFSTDPNARMYRTGDLVRWRSDGELDFLGRLDHQVKVSGFRIELGEIEGALANVRAVRQAVVVAHQFRMGDTRLIAYIVADDDTGDDDAIRNELARTLPRYMVPSAVVRLDALPLTSSGKVDRKRLPAPTARRDAGPSHAAPRTPLEAKLADIWSRLLGVSSPGVRDSFFDLGGHSILGLVLLATIEREFGHRLSVATLFDQPTIEGLAQVLSSDSRQAARPVATQFSGGDSGPALVFLPSAFGHCGEGLRLSQVLPPHLRAYGISIVGDAPYWEGCESLSDIARGFVTALTEAAPSGPYVLVGYSFSGRVAFEMARIMLDLGLQLAPLVIIDTTMTTGSRKLRDRITRDLPSIIANVPAKIRQHWFAPPGELLGRVRRKLPSRIHTLLGRQRKEDTDGINLELGDEKIDSLALPQLYRKRLATSLRAFFEYQPGVYRGDALVLASKTRPLIHRAEPDLGWGPWIDGRLIVRTIRGDHHNLFSDRQVHGIVAAIVELMERLQAEGSNSSPKG